MDLSAKTLAQTISFFFGIFLLISVLSFYVVSSRARSAGYAIVEYLEIRGYDSVAERTIAEYAEGQGIEVFVSPIDEGIYIAGDQTRYKVDVKFRHVFSLLQFSQDMTYTLYTRAVSY